MMTTIIFLAINPGGNVATLANDRAALSRIDDFGVLRCNKVTLLRKGSSPGIACRIALLAANAPKSAGLSPRHNDYAKQAQTRAGYLQEAVKLTGDLREKLASAKGRVSPWKIKWALHAVQKTCDLPETFAMESRLAPKGATAVRNWSVSGVGGKPLRKLTCSCLSNLTAIAQLKGANAKSVKSVRSAVNASGCQVRRMQTSRETEYILPSRSLAKGQRQAVRKAQKKLDSIKPQRDKAIQRVLNRHRNEITDCVAEAKKRGGNRARRMKSFTRCICPSANRWRFPPGAATTVTEEGRKGAMVLSLSIGKGGRVKACNAAVK
ncbi:MAG: hypothetical protein CMH58_06440 [Myxococcales bacterium]|nr:hypothetical protein [Myxococcales bacterium]